MPICEMALFKAAYAFVLKLAPVSRGSTANFNVFITVSTRPGSFRLVAWRPVFGSAFAFRPLNEGYCIPDTVYTTSAFVHSRGNYFFPQGGKAQHSCCSAAKLGRRDGVGVCRSALSSPIHGWKAARLPGSSHPRG